MFKTLQSTLPHDEDLPERAFRIAALRRVLEGTLYDELPNAFHEEKAANGDYVPLRQRRPSVRYGLCRLVVDDSISLLFSEGHFPDINCDDEATREALASVVKEVGLNQVMIDGATRGSVGSVAIFFRVIEGRVFVDARNTEYLTPTWNPKAPDTLLKVTEQYKVKGKQLKAAGYAGSYEDKKDYWLRTVWDDAAETAYLPVEVDPDVTEASFKPDTDRTVKHPLGFVPIVWVKNLPGGDEIDGKPTFPPEAIETSIEIDYLLSQGGRGLKYASDPTLLIKEPALSEAGDMVRGAANAIVVSEKGDAKLLEINGTATEAVINYVRLLRELALEDMHGNRANADKVSAAQSGRAMELLHQALIWLADKLRISYGEGALLELLCMIVKASAKVPLKLKDGSSVPKMSTTLPVTLRWPQWFAPTSSDRQATATTLNVLVDSSLLSEETATRTIADSYDIEDVAAERVLIEADRVRREASAQKQIKINE